MLLTGKGEAIKALGQGNPFGYARRVDPVFKNMDSIESLNLDGADNVSEVMKAAAGACGGCWSRSNVISRWGSSNPTDSLWKSLKRRGGYL